MTESEEISFEPIVSLLNRYKDEFQTTADSIKTRCQRIPGEVQESLGPYVEQVQPAAAHQWVGGIKDIVTDMSPVTPDNTETYRFILETYLWLTVCNVGMTITSTLGAMLLSPMYNSQETVGPITVVLLAFFVLPYYFMYSMRTMTSLDDDERRMYVLTMALLQGAFSGLLFAGWPPSFSPPPAFLMPLCIALGTEFVGKRCSGDRRVLLASTVGAGAAIGLLFGILVNGGEHFGAGFVLWWAIVCSFSLLGLQTILISLKNGVQVNMIQTQLGSVAMGIIVGAALIFVLGGSGDVPPESVPVQ